MRTSHIGRALVSSAVLATAMIGSPTTAQAADGWRSTFWGASEAEAQKPDVVADCQGTGKAKAGCTFVPTTSWTTTGTQERTSPIQENCHGADTVQAAFTSTFSITSSITEGSSTTVTAGATPFGAVVAQVSVEYNRSSTLSNAQTFTQTLTKDIPPGYEAWTYFTPQVQHVGGYMQANYGHRVYGHFEWYYPSLGSDQVVYTSARALDNGTLDGRSGVTVKKCGAEIYL